MADRDRSAVSDSPTTNPLADTRALDELRAHVDRILDAGGGPELPTGLERDIRREMLLAQLRGGKGQVCFVIDLAPGQLAEWKPASSGYGREKRKS